MSKVPLFLGENVYIQDNLNEVSQKYTTEIHAPGTSIINLDKLNVKTINFLGTEDFNVNGIEITNVKDASGNSHATNLKQVTELIKVETDRALLSELSLISLLESEVDRAKKSEQDTLIEMELLKTKLDESKENENNLLAKIEALEFEDLRAKQVENSLLLEIEEIKSDMEGLHSYFFKGNKPKKSSKKSPKNSPKKNT